MVLCTGGVSRPNVIQFMIQRKRMHRLAWALLRKEHIRLKKLNLRFCVVSLYRLYSENTSNISLHDKTQPPHGRGFPQG